MADIIYLEKDPVAKKKKRKDHQNLLMWAAFILSIILLIIVGVCVYYVPKDSQFILKWLSWLTLACGLFAVIRLAGITK